MLSVKMLGLGHYLPEQQVSSEELDHRLGLTPGSVEKKSGLKVRHFASPDETTSVMGALAAQKAVKDAQMDFNQIDAIIAACGVGEQAIPCNAVLIQKKLGLENSGIPCFDINSTCLSFLTAVEAAAYFIEGKRFKNVLIVSSELPSKGMNWQDMETCTIFGDGAAACVLGVSDGQSKIIATHLQTHGIGSEYCKLEALGTRIPPSEHQQNPHTAYFHMDGKRVFKLASRLIKESTQILLNKSKLTIADMDLVIPHQASKLAIHHVRKQLGVDEARYGDVYETIGNQMAASIPTAMCLLRKQGRLKRDKLIYLLGSGAGLAAGGIIMIY